MPAGHSFIYYGNSRRVRSVPALEPAAAQQRDAESLEIIMADKRHGHRRMLGPRRRGFALDLVSVGKGHSIGRDGDCDAGSLNAWKETNALKELIPIRAQRTVGLRRSGNRSGSVIARAGGRKQHRQHAFRRRVEARIDPPQQVKAADEESGADEKKDRKAHLTNDKGATSAAMRAGLASAATFLQSFTECRAAGSRNGPPQSKDDAARERHHQGEQEHTGIDSDLAEARQAGWFQPAQRLHSPESECQPKRAAR